ncbi:MAG TPA: type II toxin-antitoxin system VapC family toxin [Acidobacteriaceae bacterium]|nr:type II toxin-antitoxin system VapC family toxin [Acidobacteriaceae bacterium]
MIGIDTNVLVRYLAQDDPLRSSRATQLIEHRLSQADPGFISLVTLAETVWVLHRSYGLSAAAVAATVERLLQADTLALQNEQQVFTAMIALRTGQASFSDALIGALGAWAGCAFTVTFDKKAARLPDFRQL